MPGCARLLPLILALAALPASAQIQYEPFHEVEGFVQVLEGDLISVNGTPVRLYGIDAPDLGQICRTRTGRPYDCGEASRAMLDRLIGAAQVSCTIYARLATDAEVGRCFVGRTDIAAALVRRGWAFSQPSLSNRYERPQARAQAREVGVWSGRAARPWVWRNRRRQTETR